MKWKEIALILIIGLICFGAGYSVGVFQTANFIAEKAVNYLQKYQNITISMSDIYKYMGRYLNIPI